MATAGDATRQPMAALDSVVGNGRLKLTGAIESKWIEMPQRCLMVAVARPRLSGMLLLLLSSRHCLRIYLAKVTVLVADTDGGRSNKWAGGRLPASVARDDSLSRISQVIRRRNFFTLR